MWIGIVPGLWPSLLTYRLMLNLLLPKISTLAPDLVSAEEVVVIKVMGDFISVFYTAWFVKVPLTGAALSQDLQDIDDMIQYIDRSPNSAKACLNYMQNPFKSLTERFIVLSH